MFLLHAGWPDDWRTTFVIVKAVPSVRDWHFNAASSARCKIPSKMQFHVLETDSVQSLFAEKLPSRFIRRLREFGVCMRALPCTAVPRVTGSLRYLAAKHVRRARPVDGLTA
jgi:hypothetical protein